MNIKPGQIVYGEGMTYVPPAGYVQETTQTVYIDVDDTLILWNKSDYPDLPLKTINTERGSAEVRLHVKNLNTIEKLYKMGYEFVFWSHTGGAHAHRVATGLGIAEYGKVFLSKPKYHMDDQKPSVWIGYNIWRHPDGRRLEGEGFIDVDEIKK